MKMNGINNQIRPVKFCILSTSLDYTSKYYTLTFYFNLGRRNAMPTIVLKIAQIVFHSYVLALIYTAYY